MFTTIQNMIDCFGNEEMVCISDKSQPRTGLVNETRVQCAIDDACAEIVASLACCGFNIKQLKENIANGQTYPVLRHWANDVARYHLYDTIRLSTNAGGSDHESHRRYQNYHEEIKEICKCGVLVNSEGDLLCVNKKSIVVTNDPTCLPRNACCCGSSSCCCGGI